MTLSEFADSDDQPDQQSVGNRWEMPALQSSACVDAKAAHAALQELITETVISPSECSPSEDRSVPELSDEYQIQRVIGKGGMGVVYLVHQRSLNRNVALKVLRPGEKSFGSLTKRFLSEAQHLARLRHPNIVTIHEIGKAGGEPFFTMDYIDGEPLSSVIRRGPMSPSQALFILKQVAKAAIWGR